MSKINLFSFIKLWFKNKKDIEDDTMGFPYRHPLSEPEIKKEKPVKIKKVKKPMKLSFWHKIACAVGFGSLLATGVGFLHDSTLGQGLKIGATVGAGAIGFALAVYCFTLGDSK